MAVFNRQSMKRVRWIKGPTKRDRSRFAVLTEPIGSGSRNPGDRDSICNAKQGTAGATGGRDGRAHAVRPFPSAGLALLVAPRHMATFDYLDMQMIRRAREREGEREERRWRRMPHLSVFLLGRRVNVSRVYVLGKGCSRPSHLPRE